MPRSTNCSSEQAKWRFLNPSRASSSAMIIFGHMKRQRDVIRERIVRPVSSLRATARRGHVSWSCCRSPIRRPMVIRSGLRFRRRSNRQSVSTMRGAGSSCPSTTSTNGRTPVFHPFRGSRACSAMVSFHPACSLRSKPDSSNWLDRREEERRGAPLNARDVRPPVTRAAPYARYSSDNRRDASSKTNCASAEATQRVRRF
jgi:hypothetical protein